MQRLKGKFSFVSIDKIYITVEGFQDRASLNRFKISKKRFCFCEGLLFLIVGGVVVILAPDKKMIKEIESRWRLGGCLCCSMIRVEGLKIKL